MMEVVHSITVNDVILGRGSGPNDHEGNVEYRKLIYRFHRTYEQAIVRGDKLKIVETIVSSIRRRKGRFLRELDAADALHLGERTDKANTKFGSKKAPHQTDASTRKQKVQYCIVNSKKILHTKTRLAFQHCIRRHMPGRIPRNKNERLRAEVEDCEFSTGQPSPSSQADARSILIASRKRDRNASKMDGPNHTAPKQRAKGNMDRDEAGQICWPGAVARTISPRFPTILCRTPYPMCHAAPSIHNLSTLSLICELSPSSGQPTLPIQLRGGIPPPLHLPPNLLPQNDFLSSLNPIDGLLNQRIIMDDRPSVNSSKAYLAMLRSSGVGHTPVSTTCIAQNITMRRRSMSPAVPTPTWMQHFQTRARLENILRLEQQLYCAALLKSPSFN